MTIKRREYKCGGCGQPIDPLSGSYNLVDGKPRHSTCPTSPEISSLPTVERTVSAGAGQALRSDDLRYLTIPEAAALIRASESTIRRHIREGRLPAKRLRAEGGSKSGSSKVLIEQGDLLALLEDAREAA